MQNAFWQSMSDSRWILNNIFFLQNTLMARKTAPLHGKCNFKFPFFNLSLMMNSMIISINVHRDHLIVEDILLGWQNIFFSQSFSSNAYLESRFQSSAFFSLVLEDKGDCLFKVHFLFFLLLFLLLSNVVLLL